mgnify:CR=1 FL=1
MKAAKKEKEALDKLKEMQKEAAETTQDMYENTLVLRLRKLGEYEEKLNKDLGTKIYGGRLTGRHSAFQTDTEWTEHRSGG